MNLRAGERSILCKLRVRRRQDIELRRAGLDLVFHRTDRTLDRGQLGFRRHLLSTQRRRHLKARIRLRRANEKRPICRDGASPHSI